MVALRLELLLAENRTVPISIQPAPVNGCLKTLDLDSMLLYTKNNQERWVKKSGVGLNGKGQSES